MVAALVGAPILIRLRRNPKVTIGKHDEIYYYRRATKEDALALGAALTKIGFLNDRGTNVLLWRGSGPTTISFVVADGAWDRADAISNFTEIGRRVATSVGGFPIQVNLVDATRTIRRKMNVGKTIVGTKDILYYFGKATAADAHVLGQALQSAGYFTGLGFTVALLKGEDTIVSFVVQDGAWDQLDMVFTLDRLVRKVAPAAGGLPIRMRLLNREMEIEKEMEIQ